MRLLLLLALLIGSPTTAQRQSPPDSSPPEQTVSNAHPLWKLDISRNEPAKDFLGSRIVSDAGRIFYLQGGQVKAVDAKTGQQVWAFRVGAGAHLKYSSGWLLTIMRKEIYALEPQTGRVRWTRKKREDVSGGLYAVDRNALYVATSAKLHALDLNTGRPKWLIDEPLLIPSEPFIVRKNRIFASRAVIDTFSDQIDMYNARTGKRLGQLPRRPLAILNHRVFSQDNWFLIDYPDRVYIDVHDLRTGKQLESRTYSVENRVKGSDWTSRIAVDANAVYVSGGGSLNVACFPLAQPGGKAKPDFIRVPQGDVQWLAGPYDGAFLLEWQGAVWLVRRQKDACAPVSLLEQGREIASGKLERFSFLGNGLCLSLRKEHSTRSICQQAGRC